ncbi:hypothetical protein V8E53_011157 [Lactarius tabidus]
MLPRLQSLCIKLPSSWTSRTDHRQTHLLPKTRVVLPALTSFSFDDGCTYLEDFVAKIDTPGLEWVHITLWDSHDYQIPQLSELINRTALKPSLFEDAKFYFDGGHAAFFDLGHGRGLPHISIEIPSCEGINSQVWCMAQVLRQTSAMLSNAVRLEIEADSHLAREDEEEDINDIDWLKLLCPFTAVETLHVYANSNFAESIVRALEDTLAETDNQAPPAVNLLDFPGECRAILPGSDRTIIIRYEELYPGGSESEDDQPHSPSLS